MKRRVSTCTEGRTVNKVIRLGDKKGKNYSLRKGERLVQGKT